MSVDPCPHLASSERPSLLSEPPNTGRNSNVTIDERTLGPLMRGWHDARLGRGEINELSHYNMKYRIDRFIDYFGDDRLVNSIHADDIEDWIGSLRNTRTGRPLKNSTRNTITSAIRTFFGWAYRRQLVDVDPTETVQRAPVPSGPPKAIPMDDVNAVIASAPNLRAEVMITIAVQLGLRRSEIASLQADQWDRESNYLSVTGKGSKTRSVWVTDEAKNVLERWLGSRRHGPVFPSRMDPKQGVSVETVYKTMIGAAEVIGLRINPHAYRHTMATDIAAAGGRIDALQRALGHASLNSTMQYLHVRPEDVRTAMEGRQYRSAS